MIHPPKSSDRSSAGVEDRLRDRLNEGDPAREEAFDPQELAVLRRKIVARARDTAETKASPWTHGLRWATAAGLLVVASLVAVNLRQAALDPISRQDSVQTADGSSLTDQKPETVHRERRPATDPAGDSIPSKATGGPEPGHAVSSQTKDLGGTAAPAPEPPHRAPRVAQLDETTARPDESSAPSARLADTDPSAGPAEPTSATTAPARQIRFRGPNGTQVIWSLAAGPSR